MRIWWNHVRNFASKNLESNYGLLDGVRAAQEITKQGWSSVHQFIPPHVISALSDEVRVLAPRGFQSFQEHNIFLQSGADGPQFKSSKNLIAMDVIPSGSTIKQIYNDPRLAQFLAQAFGLPKVYPSGDLMGGIYYNIFSEGDQIGWHFDNSEFSLNLILQTAEEGGDLEHVTDSWAEVEAKGFVEPCKDEISTLPLRAGTLYAFAGKRSMHRVTQIKKGERMNAIFTFNREANMKLNAYTQEVFFGRVLQ